jgi:hypothetical protein
MGGRRGRRAVGRWAWGLGGWVLVLGGWLGAAGAGDEVDLHLEEMRQRLRQPGLSLVQRARIAQEMAATLDRAAQATGAVDQRLARWAAAVELLDQFNAQNPGHPQDLQFALQAAVYVWAQARSWSQRLELAPTETSARARAVALLDEAIQRLRRITQMPGSDEEGFAQNVRFRLAEALADRARLGTEEEPANNRRREEALTLLESPFRDAGLRRFALLLRAELWTALGQPEKAQAALEAAKRVDPKAPAGDWLEVQVALALARGRFDEALQAIEQAPVEPAAKDWLAVRTRLAQRAALKEGPQRNAAEAEAFRHAEALRKAARPEARLAVVALARAIRAPAAGGAPAAFEALAEGQLALGDPDRASALELQGAKAAEAQNQPERAAELRSKAGAILFQAGEFGRADAVLTQVFDDPRAGPFRPKAGLLRCLARARRLAQAREGASSTALIEALTAQLREFPHDPTANEARWLLGQLRLSQGDRDEGIKLLAAIPHGDPRWLDAQHAIAQRLQEELDAQIVHADRAEIGNRFAAIRQTLSTALKQAESPQERSALELGLARLELTPKVGHPDDALRTCERVAQAAGLADQRALARRLRIVALAQTGRFTDAEREARAEAQQATGADLLTTARLLDQSAVATDYDLYRQRFGTVIRLLLVRPLQKPQELTPSQRAEARLRQTRGLLFSGYYLQARRSVEAWPAQGSEFEGLLDDLADTYIRLEAYSLAIDAYRLQARRSPPGSLPWLQARYGQALACYRAGKLDEARQLVEATALLHPDLGGGELRGKFVKLQERLANP